MNIDSAYVQRPDFGSYKALTNIQRRGTANTLYRFSERALRRMELTTPRDQSEFEAALRWFTQNGNSQDLLLLRKLRNNPPYATNDILALINNAEERLERWPQVANERDWEVERWSINLGNAERETYRHDLSNLGRKAVLLRRQHPTRGSLVKPAIPLIEMKILDALHELATHSEENVRREVAYVLGGWGGDSSVPVLQQLAKAESSPDVRAEAVESLGRIGGPSAAKTLLDALQEDRNEMVRAEAVDGLVALLNANEPGEDVTRVRETLQRVVQEDVSSYVRQRIVHTRF